MKIREIFGVIFVVGALLAVCEGQFEAFNSIKNIVPGLKELQSQSPSVAGKSADETTASSIIPIPKGRRRRSMSRVYVSYPTKARS